MSRKGPGRERGKQGTFAANHAMKAITKSFILGAREGLKSAITSKEECPLRERAYPRSMTPPREECPPSWEGVPSSGRGPALLKG
ncbi:hypothetical protein Nepgr_011824 [Nepenthes gracilis]|uniref:Uncharacterized protein n=1 Tax=Nepenthes gracilis TaxID=150966 RepID=A0AAD3SEZ7_NEPGR|nr:hypothetical protein Nepgr_011824 [Nepenthes gracilis]